MSGDNWLSVFLVVFREALEAGLILGIILTVLARLGSQRYYGHVAVSVLLALIASLGAGGWISSLTESAQEKTSEVLEGLISLAAFGVLTYMFFWMEKQGRTLRSSLEGQVHAAVSAKDYWALMLLPFFAVFREGAETVLFLKAVSLQSGGAISSVGAVTGLGAAVAVTALIFLGGKKISLKKLFRVTGAGILVIAAGLLAYGIHELEEAGWVPSLIYPLYNINHLLNEKEGLGMFLKALVGYNGNPSLTEFLVYWVFWAVMAWAILFRRRRNA